VAGDAGNLFFLSLQLLKALEAVAVMADEQLGSARAEVILLVAQIAMQNFRVDQL
jgi:hypothetical protein